MILPGQPLTKGQIFMNKSFLALQSGFLFIGNENKKHALLTISDDDDNIAMECNIAN